MNDLKNEKDQKTKKKESEMSTYIQQEVGKEMARILKGKGRMQTQCQNALGADQQSVNFVHLGEFAGTSLTTTPVLIKSWILDTGGN